jgi:hypothetical protein
VVAGSDGRNALADALDDAGAFVAEYRRRVARRIGARRRVEIGVADAACNEADERFAGAGLVELHLLHLERCAELLQDGGADPHSGIALAMISVTTAVFASA